MYLLMFLIALDEQLYKIYNIQNFIINNKNLLL